MQGTEISQYFQNTAHIFVKIITELPKETPDILHEQTGMETIKARDSRLAWKLYSNSQLTDNAHIRQLGQYNPIHDTHTKGPVHCRRTDHIGPLTTKLIIESPAWVECSSLQAAIISRCCGGSSP
jgi:hypothetical protein